MRSLTNALMQIKVIIPTEFISLIDFRLIVMINLRKFSLFLQQCINIHFYVYFLYSLDMNKSHTLYFAVCTDPPNKTLYTLCTAS